MSERARMERQVNDAFERVLRDFWTSQLRELEGMGMSHIPYALKVRRVLDADHLARHPPTRRAGDRPHLSVVQEPAS